MEAQDSKETLTFESALERLESIVERLEKGDVPLEQAIELFQEGMTLSQLCNGKLEQVERKIDMLVEQDGAIEKKPFTAGFDEKGEQA
ncbi:exodeoxyribonuclease VII small subunit [Paenibacillus turpanensis]|uniref:exodeoxyribonuclease VII small subunit n=1 Tax=Paenibacillus turpanensis TaxID=2689078 RepID=UPI00140D2E7F|nr:exodeoxyribonuclease VII small subunit [Paenibacillus turpanensis]